MEAIVVHIIQETIDWIKKNFIPLVDNAKDIKELMAYEGEVWMRFSYWWHLYRH